ncbi:MAG: hypothetical protein K2X82_18535, partial [Gemmataceae bacterium]|nr:hypothetical protein [Gemmataceae bacterium]
MSRPARTRRARLDLTHLEDRSTPATFTVLNTADAGDGSLRWAIDQANAAPDADTIVFDASVRGKTVGLTTFTNLSASTADVPQPAGPSAFLVTTPITIRGTGETITRTGGNAFRLFQVTAAGNLTLDTLTLSNGLAQGFAGGAAGLGGTVYNQGTLTITGCTLTGNQAVGGGGLGGTSAAGGAGGFGGGG